MRGTAAFALSLLSFAPPVALAALGGVVSERAGVIALGLEGLMRFGAFFAAWAALATGSAWLGAGAGALAGVAAAALLAGVVLLARADQIVAGIALNLLAGGLCTFLLESGMHVFGGVTPEVPLLPTVAFGGLGALAWPAPALAVLALAGIAFIYRATPAGLRLRAVGEEPRAVAAAGLSVNRLRLQGLLVCGGLAGLGGALLPLAMLGRYEDRMPAGQGFVALAALVFGKWSPGGAFGAAVFFAAAEALQLSASQAWPGLIPKGLFLAAPYLLTLALLAGFLGKATPPAADGVPWDAEAARQ